MNLLIEKESFYMMLEEVLNSSYDETFKYTCEKKEVIGNLIGERYTYFVKNEKGEELFRSYSEYVRKVNNFGTYVDKTYELNKYIEVNDKNNEIEKLFSPYVYRYKVLEILPLIINSLKEDEQGEVSFSKDEIDFIKDISKEYNKEQTNVKVRTLNKINK